MIPKLVAHRGYMEKYPENSLLGMEMSLKAGACLLEFDVQMSADHELIVLHDSDLLRTAGEASSVFDLKLPDLTSVSVNEAERLGEQFLKTPLPTLKQMMELITNYPRATAFVEIKDESLTQWGLDHVMEALQKSLMPYASQSVIIAYNLKALQVVKQRGLYSTGWVLDIFDEENHKKARELNPDYLICNHKKITGDNEPWRGDWSWMLYDITDPEQALQWSQRGVALIETRDIGAMLQHPELRKQACNHGL